MLVGGGVEEVMIDVVSLLLVLMLFLFLLLLSLLE